MGEQLELFGRLERVSVAESCSIYWELEGRLLPGHSIRSELKRIGEILGDVFLDSLVPFDIRAYLLKRREKSPRLKDSTLNREKTRITRLINAFYEWREQGRVGPYDFSHVKLPKKNPGEMVPRANEDKYRRNVVITPEDFRIWCDYAHPRIRRIAVIGILTLLRRKDVELLSNSSLNVVMDVLSGVQSKTRRTFNVPAPLTIKIIFSKSSAREERQYICDFTNFRRLWARACEESGIFFWFMDLRRSGATHLLDHGVDIRTIQNLLGHASVKMTETYLNPPPARGREAVKKLEKSFVTEVSSIDYKFASN